MYTHTHNLNTAHIVKDNYIFYKRKTLIIEEKLGPLNVYLKNAIGVQSEVPTVSKFDNQHSGERLSYADDCMCSWICFKIHFAGWKVHFIFSSIPYMEILLTKLLDYLSKVSLEYYWAKPHLYDFKNLISWLETMSQSFNMCFIKNITLAELWWCLP